MYLCSIKQTNKTYIIMETSDLKYVVNRVAENGDQFKIVIRLDDECHNGHCDFSITGTIWEANKAKIDRNSIVSGAIGDKVSKEFPEFTIFNRLHLSDSKGYPMYAIENGIYHFINSSKEVAMDYLRIVKEEYNVLLNCIEDKLYFAYVLENLGVRERWEREAKEAIKILEGLTGNEFVDNSVLYQYTPLASEQKEAIKAKIDTGFYSSDAIKQRKEDAIEAKKNIKIANLKEEMAESILKLKNQNNVKVYILVSGLSIDNFIYYDHLNKGVFNWKDYETLITKDQFDKFIKSIDYSKLPKDIKFELKK
jgi:hypothetical protein